MSLCIDLSSPKKSINKWQKEKDKAIAEAQKAPVLIPIVEAHFESIKPNSLYCDCVYHCNITHSLGDMAKEAGIYNALWRPYRLRSDYVESEGYEKEYAFEESVVIHAKELISILEKGLSDLKARPEHYKLFNSSNGFGMYKDFVPFVEEYLQACKDYPEAEVVVSR